MLLRKITSEAQGGLDVLGLGALVTTSQENDQLPPSLPEINPVPGAVVDSQLRHTFADWLNVAGVSGGKAFYSDLHARSRLDVAEAIEPLYPCGYTLSMAQGRCRRRPDRFEVRYVSANGGIRRNKDWVNVSSVCAGEYVGLEEIDDGIWNVYFGPLKLGRLHERHMRIEDEYGKLKRK